MAKFTIDAAAASKALAILVSTIDKRPAVDALNGVLVDVDGRGTVSLKATNLDSSLAITLAADVDAAGLYRVRDAFALADALKALAKVRGAQCEFALDLDAGVVRLASGRSRLNLAAVEPGDYPAALFSAWDAAETSEDAAETVRDASAAPYFDSGRPRVLSKQARKVLDKVLKRIGADTIATIERRTDDDAPAVRMTAIAAGVHFTAVLSEPGYASAPRDPYSYGYDGAASGRALAYLQTLRGSLGLPAVGECTGRLVVHNGRAVGLEVGDGRRDYAELRAMPDGWTPPADWPVSDDGFKAFSPDGPTYRNARENGPGCADVWFYDHKPERVGALVYPDGAYSLPMPAAQREPIADVTVSLASGDCLPLRVKHHGAGGTAELELDADAIADLCGPVDPSTFVPMTPIACHHGRIIATGADAARYRPAGKIGAKPNGKGGFTDRQVLDLWNADKAECLRMVADMWRDERGIACAAHAGLFPPITMTISGPGLEPVTAVIIDAPAGPPAPPADDAAPDPEPVEPEPEAGAPANVVQFKPAGRGFHIAVIEPMRAAPVEEPREALCPGTCGIEARQCRLVGACDTRGEPVEPVEPVEESEPEQWDCERTGRHHDNGRGICGDCGAILEPRDAAPAVETGAAVERRLARLEQALGLVEQAKRTPAHAAAIRRAWRLRSEFRRMREGARIERERADLSEAAAVDARTAQAAVNARITALEAAWKSERADLVETIDAGRASLESMRAAREDDAKRWQEQEGERMRDKRRLADLERDLTASRASADGIAANLAAMTRRVADDAATIARLGGDDSRPRFILSTRLEA